MDEEWIEEPRNAAGQSRASPRSRSPAKQSRRRRSSSKRAPSAKGRGLSRLSGNSLGLSDEPVYHRNSSLLSPPIHEHQSRLAGPSDAFASGPAIAPPPTERSPLLGEKTASPLQTPFDSNLYGSSPPDAVPFPRKSPHLAKRRLSEPRKRRKPIVHEGTSTSGQTLFNAINVLVGIGILAQRKLS